MTIADIIFQALEDYKNEDDGGYYYSDARIKKIERAEEDENIIGLLFEEGGELLRTIIKIGDVEEVNIPVFSNKRNNDADDDEYDDDDENEYGDDDDDDGWQMTKFEEVETKEKKRNKSWEDYEVPWSTVSEEYVFWAVDYIGEAYFYKEKPKLSKSWNYWYTEYDNDQLIDRNFSYEINDNWKYSLRERPIYNTNISFLYYGGVI